MIKQRREKLLRYRFQRRRLKGLAWALVRQLRRSEFPQLLIHQRQQLLCCARITLLNLGKYLRYVGHKDQNNAGGELIPSAEEVNQRCARSGIADRSSSVETD